jgi:cell division protein FtsN
MAAKDYSGRTRTYRKKTKPATSRSLSVMRISMTLLLLAGFVGFLWHIKHNKPETVNEPVQSEAVANPKVVEQEQPEFEPLPDIPEEDWQFFTLLPETSVKVEVNQQTQSDKRYLMQCGSFRNPIQAESTRARIALQGLESIVRESNGDTGIWYRVILGPYESVRSAEKDRHVLQQINMNGCAIWYWDLED